MTNVDLECLTTLIDITLKTNESQNVEKNGVQFTLLSMEWTDPIVNIKGVLPGDVIMQTKEEIVKGTF